MRSNFPRPYPQVDRRLRAGDPRRDRRRHRVPRGLGPDGHRAGDARRPDHRARDQSRARLCRPRRGREAGGRLDHRRGRAMRPPRARRQRVQLRSFPDLPEDNPLRKFFDQFGGPSASGGDRPQRGERPQGRKFMAAGSGFAISADGYVVTNNHVVAQRHQGDRACSTMATSRTATVVGTDERTDLAVVKIEGVTDLPFVNFADDVAARRRLGGCRRQSVRPRRHRDRRHRLGPRPRHRAAPPMAISCRSMLPSTPAIRAARPSTSRVKWSA